MKKVETEIVIPKNIGIVWKTLVNPNAFPIWNHQIEKMEGSFALHNKIAVYMHLHNNPEKKYKFIATITNMEENKIFGWKGGIPGFLYGHHYWQIKSSGEDTIVTQVEEWSGVYPLFMSQSTLHSIKVAYEESNIGFKKFIMDHEAAPFHLPQAGNRNEK